MKVLYTAEATSAGDGRNGQAWSSDRSIDVQLSTPEGLGGAGGDGTNPEQLFAVGYAACFHNALLISARRAGANMKDSTVGASVSLGQTDALDYQLSVSLHVSTPSIDPETATALIDQAHQMCPYSRATRGNIEVHISNVAG